MTAINGVGADVGGQIALASGAHLTLNTDGTFSYDPNGAFDALATGVSDADSFTYMVSDGFGGSDTANATITINGLNDAPVAEDDGLSTDEETPLVENVFVNNGHGGDSDIDLGDVFSVTKLNGAAANVGAQITLASGALLTLNANGAFSYDPNGAFDALAAGETGSDSFSYIISDGADKFDMGVVTVTIDGVTPTIIGGPGNNALNGTDRAERIDADVGNDTLFGVGGNDTLVGGDGDDQLFGGDGDDQLFAGFGDDRADGGTGNDLIRSGPGKDTLLGGDGDDTLGASNRADLLRGEGGNDLMLGSNGNDRLFGGDGDDTMLGGNGRDTLSGGAGADRLAGGNQVDTASYETAGAGVSVSLVTGTGAAGEALGDVLIDIENLLGSAFADTLVGSSGANRISGEAGNDAIDGLGGADQLIGGAGDDTLAGGAGSDTFLFFSNAPGADAITDFAAGAGSDDVIRLIGFGAAFDSFTEVIAAAAEFGADTVIDFGGGNSITLAGVSVGDLHADDFLFG